MINFTKDLLPINPAYNNSIIQFYSDTITGATKATITIEGDSFVTVPLDNVFTFNFKEIIKTKINSNRFEDVVVPNLITEDYIQPDPTIGREFNVNINVQNYTTGETLSKTYYFQRSVEQLPNYHRLTSLPNGIRVLLPTANQIDYNVKYFEGFPFDFTVNNLRAFNSIYFKNITTNQQTDAYYNITDEAKRIIISDGGTNTTNTDILVNSSTLNKIELYLNETFKANINITKVESQCGVYLKWLNYEGSYSYWLFDSIFKDNLTPKTIDDFAGYYDNLQNLTSTSHLIGKTATKTLQINTKFDNGDAEYLSDLVMSPAVWMYAHQVPFQQIQDKHDWIGVKVSDAAFQVDRKNSKQKLNLTITLPDVNTITQ